MARRPKPTKLKALQGNPGKRALNKNEPKPSPGIPPPPAHLSKLARIEWDRITPELDMCQLVTQADQAALALYCSVVARVAECQEHLNEDGYIIEDANGNSVRSPWLISLEKAEPELRRAANEFGCTPAARAKLSVEKKPEVDPLDELLERRKTPA